MSGSSDYLFFNGYNAKGEQGLWISDGNGGDGTHEITGIVGAYAGGIDPSNITVFNGEILFSGIDTSGQGGLWTTDGFAGGTKELAGTSGLDPSDLTVFGNEVLFFGTDGSGQRGLWETDGTAAGTKEIEAGVNGSDLTVLGNGAWFGGVDGGLWVANNAGATEVIPGGAGVPLGTAVFGSATYTLTAPPGGLQPYGLDALNGNLLFGGSYQYTYTQSGVTGTATTTSLFEISGSTLQLLNPVEPAGIYQPTHLGLVFWAPGPIFNFTPTGWVNDGFYQGIGALWATDGTTANTLEISGSQYEAQTLDPTNIIAAEGYLLFNGTGGGNARDMYLAFYDPAVANGTPAFLLDLNYATYESAGVLQQDVVFTGALAGGQGVGLNPSDMKVMNSEVYFNGFDAAGHEGLWLLNPQAFGTSPFFSPSIALQLGPVFNPQGVYLNALGYELFPTGADATGVNPADLTVARINFISMSGAIILLNGPPVTGGTNVIDDTPENIQDAIASELGGLASIGVSDIIADGSLVFSVAQALALEEPVTLTVPAGDTVTVSDTAGVIETLTAAQIAELPVIGFTGITATDGSVVLTVAQASALESAGLAISVPSGDTVSIADIAAQIETLTASQIAALPAAAVTAIAATDAAVVFSIAQAVALNGIVLTMPAGASLSIADTAADIAALGASQIVTLRAYKVIAIAATDTSIVLSVDEAVLLSGVPFGLTAPEGDTVLVAGNAAAVAGLTPAQIAALPALGVTAIQTYGYLAISVAQAVALQNASVSVAATPRAPSLSLVISDTAADIEALTAAELSHLPSLTANVRGILTGITATDASVALTAAQVVALLDVGVAIAVPYGDTVSIADTAAGIETLTAPEITALLAPLGSPGFTVNAIEATDAPVVLTVAQAVALEGGPGERSLSVVAPIGDSVTIADRAAAIETMTPLQIQTLSVTAIRATDASIVFTAAQAEAIVSRVYVSAPVDDTVTIADTAAAIENLVLLGYAVSVLYFAHVTNMAASDTSVTLTAAEALSLEAATVAVSAPAGDQVALTDTAANIEALTPAQIAALAPIGFTEIVATDTSVVLTVAQALALEDPIAISAPAGQTVTIVDSETAIDTLTPAQIDTLAAVGVSGIGVANLTGAAPLTIEGGITLTVSGAVAAAQTITFLNDGGVLRLSDPAEMAGTISGFAPPDTIDLSGATYDVSAVPSLGVDNLLTVTEDSGTYTLQLDPAQIFLTTPTFLAVPDATTGTALMETQPAVDFYAPVPAGQTAYDVVVASGGQVDVQDGGAVNGGTVNSGGVLTIESGGTVAGSFTIDGGLLDLIPGSEASGTIAFGAAGGTLEIDDTTIPAASIAGFAEGDWIDLTAVPHAGGDQADLLSGGTLQLITSAGQYDLRLSSSAALTHDYFWLSPDGVGGTDIGVINELLPRTLIWTGAQDTNFANATDWNDTTTNLNPAPLAPDSSDAAQFLSAGGTITGNGTAATLGFGGSLSWDVTSGASLSATSGVTVGEGGAGSLLINGGAQIDSLGPVDTISGNPAQSASVTVDGEAATWSSAGELIVGVLGAGALTVSNAATFAAAALGANPAMVLGVGAGGTGTLSVAGGRASLVG